MKRAERLADADDITPRILKEAAKMENVLKETGQTNGAGGWVEVKPEMLEGELEEELAKFEKFGADINESGAEQEGCLEELEVRSVLRSDAPS